MTETYIHIAMRNYLKKQGWTLVAGEYPGGSDDELFVLSIMDPTIAKDNSPDPRRHSEGEIVPDLFAYKDGVMIVVEAKPKYNAGDREKLKALFSMKLNLMKNTVRKFCGDHHLLQDVDLRKIVFIPALAFENVSFEVYPEDKGFAHIYVRSLKECKMVYFREK